MGDDSIQSVRQHGWNDWEVVLSDGRRGRGSSSAAARNNALGQSGVALEEPPAPVEDDEPRRERRRVRSHGPSISGRVSGYPGGGHQH
jgi:hypothetical protein